jgi:methionine biosynthesis protein MetW
MSSPDFSAAGFLAAVPEALRYENQSLDPDDVAMRLASLVRHGSKILDVGCGTGSITELLKRFAQVDIIGIEPDPLRAMAARERGLTVFGGFLSEEFFTQRGTFDTIVLADVLEHLSAPAQLMTIAKCGLAPGGSIVLSVPNVAHWSVRLKLLFGQFDYTDCGIMDATHLRWFTRDSLNRFLSNLGFRVTDHLYTLNTGMVEYRTIPPWRWIGMRITVRVVRPLLRTFPTVFGCQHVVRVVVE